ncbi:MAG: hypothetical protein PHX43_01645 [Alphaproteobacteria bacterium]|nr:hypothetical protein [Alphaproteobacteria bacterium]
MAQATPSGEKFFSMSYDEIVATMKQCDEVMISPDSTEEARASAKAMKDNLVVTARQRLDEKNRLSAQQQEYMDAMRQKAGEEEDSSEDNSVVLGGMAAAAVLADEDEKKKQASAQGEDPYEKIARRNTPQGCVPPIVPSVAHDGEGGASILFGERERVGFNGKSVTSTRPNGRDISDIQARAMIAIAANEFGNSCTLQHSWNPRAVSQMTEKRLAAAAHNHFLREAVWDVKDAMNSGDPAMIAAATEKLSGYVNDPSSIPEMKLYKKDMFGVAHEYDGSTGEAKLRNFPNSAPQKVGGLSYSEKDRNALIKEARGLLAPSNSQEKNAEPQIPEVAQNPNRSSLKNEEAQIVVNVNNSPGSNIVIGNENSPTVTNGQQPQTSETEKKDEEESTDGKIIIPDSSPRNKPRSVTKYRL